MATIKTSDLAGKLKDQFLQQSEIFKTEVLVDDMNFLEYMAPPILTKDEVPLTRVITGDIVQPGAKAAFNASSDAHTFKARTSKVRAGKVDLTYTPVDINLLANSYYGYLAQIKKTYHDYSIAEFFMDAIKRKIKDNIRLKALYDGVYDASGTGPEDIFDGILTQMAVSGVVPAGNIYTGAALTASNAVDIFEATYDKVPAKYQSMNLAVIASPSALRKYFLDYRSSYGSVIYNQDFLKNGIDGTSTQFFAEPGLDANPNKIIITTMDNLTWHVNPENDMEAVTIETEKRNVHVMVDFDVTPNFFTGDEIWTNAVTP
jgi:hypothetical protein